MPRPAIPFRCFNSAPAGIRLVGMVLFERCIAIGHATARLWCSLFGPLFAGDIRRQRVARMQGGGIGVGTSTMQEIVCARLRQAAFPESSGWRLRKKHRAPSP